MAGKSITGQALRTHGRARVLQRLRPAVMAVIRVLLAAMLSLLLESAVDAAPVNGEVAVSTSGGYARLIFTLADEIEANVRLANGIVVITFGKPVAVSVDRVAQTAGGYVAAARADPDGAAIRLALTRKVTVNSMAAGEKFFVDLLPEDWAGLPPGLPQEVVDELARRAREADKKAREQKQLAALREQPAVRVRVGAQPTFTRYVFELPGLVPIAHDRVDNKLTLTFEAPLRFDLADVQAALPPSVQAIESGPPGERVTVRFAFIGKVDVRTFREDNNYVVDVQPIVPRVEAPSAQRPGQPNGLISGLIETRPAPNAAVPPAAAPSPPATPPQAIAPPAATPPPAAASKAPEPPAPTVDAAAPPARDPAAPVVVEVKRQGDTLRLVFPFATPTPAAVFGRADSIWLVFDSQAPIDIAQVIAQAGRTIVGATVTRSREGEVVQVKLDRAKLTSVSTEGAVWAVTVGDVALEPTRPLGALRNTSAAARANVTIPFDQPAQLHRLSDPDVGDTLFVVTALGPARGFVKSQDFVEFRALASTHGVVIQPLADDVTAEVTPEKIIVTRPGGLTLSGAGARATAGPSAEPVRRADRAFLVDPQVWGADRASDFRERQTELIRAAADAEALRRNAARLDLARFYLARGMEAEAKGVLDLLAGDERAVAEDARPLVLRAIANILLHRPVDAMKDLTQTAVGNHYDAPLWRALAQSEQGDWAQAREGFKTFDAAIATLPVELQRQVCMEALRAAIEARDFGDAVNRLHELETLGVPSELAPAFAVLKGRVAEGLGHLSDALALYHGAADTADRAAAAQAGLREIALRQKIGDVKREDAVASLETLTTIWRGDETEAEALAMLARFYGEDGRYRDQFHIMRVALVAHPRSEMTRRIQDEAATAFEALFLTPKGDGMPAIDALSLFYDFRNLTPVGRRGDEMIRRLADRLVSVDLLDQAAELLQHQVDNRLQGAARAQVAARLAVVYLMARKPDRAIQTLRTSRAGDLPTELRNQRLMIEARALSDTGRADVALEVVGNMNGREVERLRADILWRARRWRAAAEQIEKLLSERWRDPSPLTDPERADVLRGALGYTLGEETIGLDRFRQKYLPRMAEGPDRRAFDIVTAPFAPSAPEFAEIAKTIAAVDTLDIFLRDIKARPDTAPVSSIPAAPATAPPLVTGSAG